MKRKFVQVLVTVAVSMATVIAPMVSPIKGADETWKETQDRALMQALEKLEEVGNDYCKNEVLSEAVSPDKQWKAVIFQRRCGVGAQDTTNVSIIGATEALKNEPGNAFSLEGTPVYTVVSVEWNAPSQLTITYKRDNVVCFAARLASGTVLFYKLAPKP